MSPAASIIMLAGIYYGAMYGGSTTSILANIPGEAASVVTCLDGYQMARAGRAGPALGIAAFGSFIAGTLSVLGITVLAPPHFARIALRFGPPEIFAVLLLGFTLITHLSGAPKLRTAAMALLGMLLGTVGIDPISGVARFTFGTLTLHDGVGLVPMIMGLFGVSEVFLNIEGQRRQHVFKARIAGLLPTREDWRAAAAPIGRGSILGFFLGIVPGIGTIIPTFIVYALEKRLSKHPERFGQGAIEGVAGPGGQQRRHGRRADSAPHPGRGAQRADGGAPRRVSPPRGPTGPADDHGAAGAVLGRGGQHVRGQRAPAGAEPAPDRSLGAAPACPMGSCSHSSCSSA